MDNTDLIKLAKDLAKPYLIKELPADHDQAEYDLTEADVVAGICLGYSYRDSEVERLQRRLSRYEAAPID